MEIVHRDATILHCADGVPGVWRLTYETSPGTVDIKQVPCSRCEKLPSEHERV